MTKGQRTVIIEGGLKLSLWKILELPFTWIKNNKTREIVQFIFWMFVAAPVSVYGFYEAFIKEPEQRKEIKVIVTPPKPDPVPITPVPPAPVKLSTGGKALLESIESPTKNKHYFVRFTSEDKVKIDSDFLSGLSANYSHKDDWFTTGGYYNKARCREVTSDIPNTVRFQCTNIYNALGLSDDGEWKVKNEFPGLYSYSLSTIFSFDVFGSDGDKECHLYKLNHMDSSLKKIGRKEFIDSMELMTKRAVHDGLQDIGDLISFPAPKYDIKFEKRTEYLDEQFKSWSEWSNTCDIELSLKREGG